MIIDIGHYVIDPLDLSDAITNISNPVVIDGKEISLFHRPTEQQYPLGSVKAGDIPMTYDELARIHSRSDDLVIKLLAERLGQADDELEELKAVLEELRTADDEWEELRAVLEELRIADDELEELRAIGDELESIEEAIKSLNKESIEEAMKSLTALVANHD